MKTIEASEASPIVIGIKYSFFLVLAMLLCTWIVGTETILMSAMASKPYSVLLKDSHLFNLITEYYESSDPQDMRDSEKVICLGDSNSFYPPDHIVPRNTNRGVHLAGLLHEAFENSPREVPQVRFSDWSYVGATMFDYYCLFHEAEKFSPDLVLVPITWFTFGSAWLDHHDYYRLELSALVPLRSELPEDYEDPIRSEGISAIKQLEYKVDLYSLFPVGIKFWIRDGLRTFFYPQAKYEIFSPVENPNQPSAGNGAEEQNGSDKQSAKGDFPPLWRAAHTYFPMRVEPSNPALRDMRALAHVASSRGTKLLFFVWPVNVEYIEKVGALEKAEMRRSRQFIKDWVERENVYFVDFSGTLGHEYFYDMQGHLTVEGRKRIAEALFPKVLEILEESSNSKQSEPGRASDGRVVGTSL
jgi:hypothetical protein